MTLYHYCVLGKTEAARSLDSADREKWGRRSEMELSHWAQAGRLA